MTGGVVSLDWAAARTADPSVRFVQVDEDGLLYSLGHIPGAVSLAWDTDLLAPGGRDLAAPEALAARLGQLGIGPDTTVVAYGDQSNLWAGFACWVLRYAGHAHVRLLDGGHRAWAEAGLALTAAPSPVEPVPYPPPAAPGDARRAQRREVEAAVRSGDVLLLDVRSASEYEGGTHPALGFPVGSVLGRGRIPGARSLPWDQLVDPATSRLLPVPALIERLGRAGVGTGRPIIAYCLVGVASGFVATVLADILGDQAVAAYDGGWLEWGSAVGLPRDN